MEPPCSAVYCPVSQGIHSLHGNNSITGCFMGLKNRRERRDKLLCKDMSNKRDKKDTLSGWKDKEGIGRTGWIHSQDGRIRKG